MPVQIVQSSGVWLFSDGDKTFQQVASICIDMQSDAVIHQYLSLKENHKLFSVRLCLDYFETQFTFSFALSALDITAMHV